MVVTTPADYVLIFDDEEVDRLIAGERVERTQRHWFMALRYEVSHVYNVQRRSRSHGDFEVDVHVRLISHRREQIGKGRKRPQFNHIFTFEAVKQ